MALEYHSENGQDVYDLRKSETQQSVSEEQEISDGDDVSFFGVRSYLYNFYEDVTMKNPDVYEDFDDYNYQFLTDPQNRCKKATFWRITFCIGLLLLIFGLILLLLGYFLPQKRVVVDFQADLEIIDRSALVFNQHLDICKGTGLIIFCLGGIISLAALLLSSLVTTYCDEYSEIVRFEANFKEIPSSPTDKIPITEKLTNVQPKDRENHMVVTTTGLHQVP
ncbi:neurensin-1-like [Limulus polyphemus]|uniref:Neurensin-1-like n=1 Tax=Limulus polyphemus TaxID=6850 RepID=A0ABM1BXA3_LIMPO|nr:neurensin-1-like [Limulus polyphemus]